MQSVSALERRPSVNLHLGSHYWTIITGIHWVASDANSGSAPYNSAAYKAPSQGQQGRR